MCNITIITTKTQEKISHSKFKISYLLTFCKKKQKKAFLPSYFPVFFIIIMALKVVPFFLTAKAVWVRD